jgi:peptidyl-prolyl cis-trans isomerase SurA
VPKSMEPQIRKGALQMVIFEESLYQEAKRRNLPIAAEKLASAEKRFRQQFSPQQYSAYLKTECNNSAAVLHEKIRRSLLIESMMKTEVEQRSRVTVADAKAYYDQNAKEFEHGETASFQTISMIPPEGATKAMQQEAFDKIKDALRLAREAKNYNEFGILAEQISDDDWRTMMGDRKTMDLTKMPPEVATAIRATKVGQVSDIIKVDRAYVIVRVNAHTPAGRTSFADVKDKLQQELQAQRTQQVRSALNTKLTQTARIELL